MAMDNMDFTVPFHWVRASGAPIVWLHSEKARANIPLAASGVKVASNDTCSEGLERDASERSAELLQSGFDATRAVPLPRKRRNERQFDQMERAAQEAQKDSAFVIFVPLCG